MLQPIISPEDTALEIIANKAAVHVHQVILGNGDKHYDVDGQGAAGMVRELARDHVTGVVIVTYGVWLSLTYIFKIRGGKYSF